MRRVNAYRFVISVLAITCFSVSTVLSAQEYKCEVLNQYGDTESVIVRVPDKLAQLASINIAGNDYPDVFRAAIGTLTRFYEFDGSQKKQEIPLYFMAKRNDKKNDYSPTTGFSINDLSGTVMSVQIFQKTKPVLVSIHRTGSSLKEGRLPNEGTCM